MIEKSNNITSPIFWIDPTALSLPQGGDLQTAGRDGKPARQYRHPAPEESLTGGIGRTWLSNNITICAGAKIQW